jgi:hypothetical protein
MLQDLAANMFPPSLARRSSASRSSTWSRFKSLTAGVSVDRGRDISSSMAVSSAGPAAAASPARSSAALSGGAVVCTGAFNEPNRTAASAEVAASDGPEAAAVASTSLPLSGPTGALAYMARPGGVRGEVAASDPLAGERELGASAILTQWYGGATGL